MRILVYGAGAVGGYVGASLAQSGHDLTVVVRDITAEAIESKGLMVKQDDHAYTVHPTVRTSIAHTFQTPDVAFDLIILGMKAYDIKTAVDHLVAFCPEPPPILTLQNGIGVERPFVEQFGAPRIIVGALTTPVSKPLANQIVVERSDRGLGLAPAQPGQAIDEWVNLFNQAGLTTIAAKDYQAMKWSKAFLNIVANATSAILNRPPGVVYKSETMFDLEVRMLRETLAVMDALRLEVMDLPGSPATRLAFGVRRAPKLLLKPILTGIVAKGRGEKMPSFQIDLMAGKGQSEVVFHNGAIAKAGHARQIPTPVNTTLTDVLLRIARNELDWRDFDGKPARLLTEVARFEKS
jgi:2-dehydropantoate 2-reductase